MMSAAMHPPRLRVAGRARSVRSVAARFCRRRRDSRDIPTQSWIANVKGTAGPSTQETLIVAVCLQPFDADAWSRFVALYGPPIVAWCRRYGLQSADARDVAQNVLMQFLRQSARFKYDRTKRFRGYLRAITHAAWCDWVERNRPIGDELRGVEAARLLAETPARDDLARSLEARYDRELLDLAMAEVRGRVEPLTWEVFHLLAIEGLSGKEVVARTGMKLGSAFAARHKVQRLIKEIIARHDA